MEHLKDALNDILKHLEELEVSARKLANQNLADIAASAKGRVQQLTEHPDLELVHKELSGGNEPNPSAEPLPFDPNAGAPAPDTYVAPPVSQAQK